MLKWKKQRDYSHLAKARAKGAEVRKAKAEARRLKKAEEKAEKDRIKAEKRAATTERNRQRAKDRYYEKKKQSHKEPVVKQVIKPGPAPTPAIANGMDFNTFANYMLKYENMKKKYKDAVDKQTAEKERKRQEAIRKKDVKKEPAYHPENYPLAHLYNPHLRKNKTYF